MGACRRDDISIMKLSLTLERNRALTGPGLRAWDQADGPAFGQRADVILHRPILDDPAGKSNLRFTPSKLHARAAQFSRPQPHEDAPQAVLSFSMGRIGPNGGSMTGTPKPDRSSAGPGCAPATAQSAMSAPSAFGSSGSAMPGLTRATSDPPTRSGDGHACGSRQSAIGERHSRDFNSTGRASSASRPGLSVVSRRAPTRSGGRCAEVVVLTGSNLKLKDPSPASIGPLACPEWTARS